MTRTIRPMLADSSNPPWRPDVKHREIVSALRRELLDGRYAPGSRLPTRAELIDRFDVSAMTVQHAVDRLKHDGFIVARGRHGTFVAEHPPHLHQYGLIFSSDPTALGEDRRPPFLAALQREAGIAGWTDKRARIRVYRHLASGSKSQDYGKLMADASSQRLAGVIVADPWRVRNWVRDLPVPAVGFSARLHNADRIAMQYHVIEPDFSAFHDRALDELASRGVRRVGFVIGRQDTNYFASLCDAVARHGMEIRPEWVQGVDPEATHWARHSTLAMMRGDAANRPQGLVIAEDSLLEPVAAGLRDAGVNAASDLCVIAHANFPFERPSSVQALRLGFVPRNALQTAMNLINRMRRREPMSNSTALKPVFESELASIESNQTVEQN